MKLIVIACALLFARAAVAGPEYSCKSTKNPTIVYDRQTKKTTEVNDYIVDCVVKVDGKQIWAGALPLAHPATRAEAYGAIDEFIDKKAPEIVKGYKQ